MMECLAVVGRFCGVLILFLGLRHSNVSIIVLHNKSKGLNKTSYVYVRVSVVVMSFYSTSSSHLHYQNANMGQTPYELSERSRKKIFGLSNFVDRQING